MSAHHGPLLPHLAGSKIRLSDDGHATGLLIRTLQVAKDGMVSNCPQSCGAHPALLLRVFAVAYVDRMRGVRNVLDKYAGLPCCGEVSRRLCPPPRQRCIAQLWTVARMRRHENGRCSGNRAANHPNMI